jgi:hypothetical protein
VLNRIRQFRAALLLGLASAIIFWPISYWLPLGEYLGVLNTTEYAEYQIELKSFVALYLIFFILNLITAGLTATRFNYRVKYWLALVPAGLLLIVPFLLSIPIAIKFSDRNYFEVLGAFYRLFRFTKPELLAVVFLCTFIAVALNVLAALIIRSAADVDKVTNKVRNRYFIYAGAVFAILAIAVSLGSINAAKRSLDRAQCNNYAAIALPETDKEVIVFLSQMMVFGEASGTDAVKSAFTNFSTVSRQYYSLLNSEADEATLTQYQLETATAKDKVTEVCSEYAVK